jgi:hypothetical protein
MKPTTTAARWLADAGSITEEELQRAALLLPFGVRDRLAAGPLPRRWSCGVCDAFGADWYRNATPNLADPMWIVWCYHEAPKSRMTHRDQLHYGLLANETYERTLATYRAAGWNGKASEANA